MKYKMTDVLNFIGRVAYIQFEDSSNVYDVNTWLEEYGNINVDVINVIEHATGVKTIIVK